MPLAARDSTMLTLKDPEDTCVQDAAAPEMALELAGLTYVDDSKPGYRRERDADGGFRYLDTRGRPIDNPRVIARIDGLAIPPAYEDVWICPNPTGHIQATARDARGRKQYRYHPEWTAIRDANKYHHLVEFGLCLPRIRRRVAADLKRPGLSQDRVTAVVVQLLETTLIRIGNPRYARTNRSYGLTTLTRRHASVAGSRIRFQFVGKSGVAHDVTVNDARIARIVKRCMEIPGQHLFHYHDDDGNPMALDSGTVNAYLKETSGQEFTAKHYRTWAASVYAHAALSRQPWTSETAARRVMADVVRQVSQRLANTPAVCRACYIHPAILDAYLAGRLPGRGAAPGGPRGLNADERRLLDFLRQSAELASASD